MEKLEKYRNFVEKIIVEHSQYKPSYGDIEVQVIFDRERDRYLLGGVGGIELFSDTFLSIDA